MLLQPKLNLKVSQRQVLTPGLVQMVSVLALNKLELREMINTEMVENPVLEELEESAVSLEERAGIEGDRERSAEEVAAESERVEKDPFDEIDFGMTLSVRHVASEPEDRFHAIEQFATPVVFQHAPAAFDRVVFAVVRRIVRQLHPHLRRLREADHAVKELASCTAAFRSVVEIHEQRSHSTMTFAVPTPPIF